MRRVLRTLLRRFMCAGIAFKSSLNIAIEDRAGIEPASMVLQTSS